MNKTLVIHHCDHCPFFDNDESWGAPAMCKRNDRVVDYGKEKDRYMHPIPPWCPLEEVTVVGDATIE